MAGLVPAIHDFAALRCVKTWMPGTRPGMTDEKPLETRMKRNPAVHPGSLLKRELTARELSANRLALDIGVPSGLQMLFFLI